MKKTAMSAIYVALLPIMLVSLYSFSPVDADPKPNKVGVWKTYGDYINNKLTDLGTATDRVYKEHGAFYNFQKENIEIATTKYWGARVPIEYKYTGYSKYETPYPRTSRALRFYDGKSYPFIFDPKPIGVFGGISENFSFDTDDNPSYTTTAYNTFSHFGGSLYSINDIWASKGDGPLVQIKDKKSCRDMFDDDPELQKQYDKDLVTFKLKSEDNSVEEQCTFLKYVRKYNRKHGTLSVEPQFHYDRKGMK